MKQKLLLKTMLLLCALIVGSGTMWGQTYEQLTSIANIDESAEYVLGIDGTGFHYSGTSGWGLTAKPSEQTPIMYTLKKATDGKSFTAETTISNTKYYLQIPTTNTFSMATSTGTNTDIIIGTTQSNAGDDKGYAVANKGTTTRHLRRNGTNGIRSYAGNTGSLVFFYKVIPAFTLTAESNNTSWGTVAVSGNKITANPATGYRISATTPYTVTSGTVTSIVQNNNEFTVTASAACTVRINFEAIPIYTVSFNAEGGSCSTTSLTESLGGQGVTLPTATISVNGWEFVGWATATVTNTFTMPTLYKAGATYKPASSLTLYAVYTLKETGSTFVRVTSASQVEFAKSVVVVYNADNYILNHSRATQVAAPTETNGEITAPSNTIFTLAGNNTDGFTLTGTNGSLSQTTVSTSSSNDRATDWNGNNNLWKIEENANATNTFALSNSDNVALEYYNGWKTEYNTSYNNRSYTAMRLYIPKSVYNSNPSALIVPDVSFEKGGTTLYLDAEDKTYTNAANVTGVSKTINYSSSNTSVATVSNSGVVTAVGIGTATITASVDVDLGVSTSASDTYDVTVKSATTLAGIKAQATSSTAVDFTADLASDLVITYVNGTHAYLQSGDVAVYAAAGEGWEAGKKFTGAISGKVKVANSQYQITVIDQTPGTDGVIPDAIAVDIADLTAENYTTYEGRKVAITGATISTAMANTATTGGVISDGTNTVNINAPEKGVALTLNEKGNFIGYIGRYNTGIRLCMYDQNWFTKTHNAPQNQNMAFEKAAFNLDEETDAVTSFAGQAVTATTVKGALTYCIKEGSADIITSLDATTGAVVLNGSCGTATIVATAAYYEEVGEGGYLTPYKELTIEYTITVRPRYSVTFSVNGNTDEVRRQESYGAAITAPDVASVGNFEFKGWSDTEVVVTNTEPTMTTGASITPTANKTVYAVYAIKTQTGTTEVEDQSYSYSAGTLTVDGNYSDKNSYYLLHEGGYVESAEFDLSIISKVVVYGGTYGGSDNNSLTIGDGTNTWKDVIVSGKSETGTNTYTGGTALSGTGKLRITSTCGGTTNGVRVSGFKIYKLGPVYGYSSYCTSVPASISLTPAKTYTTLTCAYPLDFTNTTIKAYIVLDDDATDNEITMTQVNKVPAGQGMVLEAQTPDTEVSVPVLISDPDDVEWTNNKMEGSATATTAIVANGGYILSNGAFHPATDGNLPAGKAYLHIAVTSNAPVMSFGDATSVNDVRSKIETISGNIYNLNGQKVEKPGKGLYIVNGKKVVIK